MTSNVHSIINLAKFPIFFRENYINLSLDLLILHLHHPNFKNYTTLPSRYMVLAAIKRVNEISYCPHLPLTSLFEFTSPSLSLHPFKFSNIEIAFMSSWFGTTKRERKPPTTWSTNNPTLYTTKPHCHYPWTNHGPRWIATSTIACQRSFTRCHQLVLMSPLHYYSHGKPNPQAKLMLFRIPRTWLPYFPLVFALNTWSSHFV